MKNFFKQLFCHHDWSLDDINEFETRLNDQGFVKCMGETIVCRKCGKKVFHWIKAPFEMRTLW